MNEGKKRNKHTRENAFQRSVRKDSLNSIFINVKKILTSTPSADSEEKSEEKKQIIKKGGYICMFFTLGFLFSSAQLAFGSYPLALSLIGGASSYVFTISLGMLCGISVSILSPAHFLALTVLIIIRILGRVLLDKPEYRIKSDISGFIRYDLWGENIYLRLSAVSVAIFSVGLWNIIANNFRFFDLWGALLGMIVSPIAAYLFSLFFDSEKSNAKELSVALFIACSVFSLKQFEDMGLFLAASASFVTVLTLSRKTLPIYTLTFSLLLGLICGIKYTPIFFVCALVYLLLNYFGKPREYISLLFSLSAAVVLSVIISGKESFYSIFPASLSAAAIDNLLRACIPGLSPSSECIPAKTKQELIANTENQAKLEKMSRSFENLSHSFKRLSDRLAHPGVYEIRKECDDVIEKFCSDCKNCRFCWGDNYNNTIAFLSNVSTHLSKHSVIDESFVPESMKERCKYIDKIILNINEKTKTLYRDTLEKEKLNVFSADYSALSKIISDSILEKQSESSENNELTEKALGAMGKYKNDFHTVSVWGKRKIRVFARLKTLSENTVGMREFKRIMEDVCECNFLNPTLKIEGKSMTVTLNIKPVFKAEASSSNISADERYMCGDTPSFFEGHDNYFYAIISDGMGTGSNAALASGISEVFLREMLEGGNRIETSLSMLNSVLTAKGDECSATVDIMELDLLNGKASFVKSGAASSFILRDGNVYRLSARTMPLGILDEIDADIQKVRLREGDTVFLVSDGNAPMDNYENLIALIKATLPFESLDDISKRITENSKKFSKDDVSCVVIRVAKI